MTERDLFIAALQKDAPIERRAFLEEACRGDAALRERIDALLAMHERAGSFLEAPAAGLAGEAAQADSGEVRLVRAAAGEVAALATQLDGTGPCEGPGSALGPYKLLERIGEGGFGTVYLAEQKEPVRRKVAIKVIKLGMDTRQVIARFEAERQALAMMDHPHIAKVFDAGATDTGRPYFVMELVRGVPITQYCDDQRVPLRERLALFTDVCHAVQHAHQKGIIHRDLKPSNVLVSRHDDKPVVKVIDFGIVKATGGRLTDKTMHTEWRQLIGTPAYMSPEQAGASDLDVDTRSDIYSLGVLLYELLTGTTPFDATDLMRSGLAEMQRIIREVEPERPSTRISSLGVSPSPFKGEGRGEGGWHGQAQRGHVATRDTQHARAFGLGMPPGSSVLDIAKHRRTDPQSLAKTIRGDLDWIVMKCLEKDRARRYETANGLAMDVLRHLSGEAVVAAPPSTAYRVRKFVHRNRGPVIAAGLLGATLVLGLAGTLWQAQRAADRAQAAERAEAEQRRLAVSEGKARTRAEAINEFVKKALISSDPNQGGQQDTLVADAMMIAIEEIDAGAFKDDPQTEADLRDTIANILGGNGRAAEAEPLYVQVLEMRQRLFEGDHPDVASSLNHLASVRESLGRAAEAEPLDVQALEMNQRLFEGDHRDVAKSLNSLAAVRLSLGRAAEAERLFVQDLEMSQRLFKRDHPHVAASLNNLAAARQALGRDAEAEPLYVQALEMNRRLFKGDHPDVAKSLYNVAFVRTELGRAAEAEPLYVQALEMRQRLFKGDHPDVAMSLSSLASVRESLGRAAEAEPLCVQALEMYQGLFEGDHPNVAGSLNILARVREAIGRAAEAEPLYVQALEMRQRLFKGDHPDVAGSLNNLATVRFALGRAAEGELLQVQALEMYQRLFKGDHPLVAAGLNNLASVRESLGRAAEAEPLYVQALAMYQRLFKGDHPSVANSLNNVALLRTSLGRAAEAEPLYVQALEMRQRLFKGDHPDVAGSLLGLAYVRESLGRAAEAEPLYVQALEMYQRLYKGDHQHVALTLNNLANVRRSLGRAAEAEPLLEQALEMHQRLFKGDRPDVASSLNNLANVRRSLGRAAEAEPLYVQALEMRQRLFKGDHPDVARSLNNLADCLDALGRGDEALARRRDALAMQRRLLSPDSPEVASWMAQVGQALVKAGTPHAAAEAEPILRECLAIRQKALPDGHAQQWLRFNTMSLLGGALAGQGKFAEAEPLLLEGYNGMKYDPRVPPPAQAGGDRKREALERVVKLYQDWDAAEPGKDYAEKAAEWRARLEQPGAPPPDADKPGPSP